MRTCLGCRTAKEKSELIRIVRTPEGEVKTDPSGKANGRGAYLCRDPKCLKRAMKTGALGRALKVPIPPELYETLSERLDEEEGK